MKIFVALVLLAMSWMSSLAPGDHAELAFADVSILLSEPPLYKNDDLRIRSLALLVAIQFRESTFRSDAIGDHGASFCSMQVHRSVGGSELLLRDPSACVRHGLSILRSSISADRDHPVAFYARGPNFKTPEAQRISDDRVAIAKRLLARLEE